MSVEESRGSIGGLSKRARGALQRLGIRTWDELAAVDEEELAALPNVGTSTMAEIRSALASRRPSDAVIEAVVDAERIHEVMREALRDLGVRRRAILLGRVVRHPPLTLQELGDEFGVSRERTRQLEVSSISRLRSALRRNPEVGELLRLIELERALSRKGEDTALKDAARRGVSPAALALLGRVAGYSQDEVGGVLKFGRSNTEGQVNNEDRKAVEMVAIVTGAESPSDFVTIRFNSPVLGWDPWDGTSFTSDMHRVAAVLTRQDAAETTFISEEGEMLARWPTALIEQISWPAAPMERGHDTSGGRVMSDAPTSNGVGRDDWIAGIKRRYPRAWESWPLEEDQELRQEIEAGMSVKDMADLHQRRPSAIRSRITKLGLDPSVES